MGHTMRGLWEVCLARAILLPRARAHVCPAAYLEVLGLLYAGQTLPVEPVKNLARPEHRSGYFLPGKFFDRSKTLEPI